MRAHSLEREASGSTRSLGARIGWLLLVIVLAAELTSVFLLSDRGRVAIDQDTGSNHSTELPDQDAGIGYTFDSPRGWSSTKNGRTTIITNGDSSVVISIGLLEGDDIGAVSDRVVTLLSSQYEDLRAGEPRSNGTSLTVRGHALNSDHVSLRFRSTTVATEGACNHQVIAFSGVGVDRARVDGVVDDLLGTLKLSGTHCPDGISA